MLVLAFGAAEPACLDRPISVATTAFLEWVCPLLVARGVRVAVLFWDNASWHISQEVKLWLGQHNRQTKQPHGFLRAMDKESIISRGGFEASEADDGVRHEHLEERDSLL